MRHSILTVPCHWNREVIEDVLRFPNECGVKLSEVYGVLAEGGPVGHGRSANAVIPVSKEEAVAFRRFLSEKGIGFTYLLNAPFRFRDDSSQRQALDVYMGWILGELRPDALTITSHELMRYVRQVDKETPIHVSTIAGVKTVSDLEVFMDANPNRVVPHHDVGKDWGSLRELVEFGRNEGVGVEVLATESCLRRCQMRSAHYEYLAKKTKDGPFHMTCNAEKLTNPREFLLAGGVIRPEDMSLYEEMGVRYFKISGRSKPSDWLPEVVEAYLSRSYEGNLVRLLGIDPAMRAEDWIYIENKALDGFLKDYPSHKTYEEQSSYCDSWMARLHSEGKFGLKDGTEYIQKEGGLHLVGNGGDRARPIIVRELGG